MLIHIRQDRNYGYKALTPTPLIDKPVSHPVLWIPYAEANDSATEPVPAKKGIYAGRIFYRDISRGGLYRAFVE